MIVKENEKYIRLLLNGDGTVSCDGGFGRPVAGESNAFTVIFRFPCDIGDRSPSVDVTFDGGGYNARLLNGGDGDYYFRLAPNMKRGGAVGISAALGRGTGESAELMRWKAYYIAVLDSPEAPKELQGLDTNAFLELNNSIGKIEMEVEGLAAQTVKRERLNFVADSFSETFESGARIVKIGGKDLASDESAAPSVSFATASGENQARAYGEGDLSVPVEAFRQLALSPVSQEHNGDMTPELLRELHSATDRLSVLGSDFVTDVQIDCLTKNGGDCDTEIFEQNADGEAVPLKGWNMQWTKADAATGERVVETVLPLASDKCDGIMSAADKVKVDACVSEEKVREIVSKIKVAPSLYRHRIRFTAYSPSYVMAFKEIYNTSSEPFDSVESVIAALRKGNGVLCVPVSGSTEPDSYNTVVCVEARMTASAIKLIGMHFGYSSGEGTIKRVTADVSDVYDTVEKVF